MSKPDPIGAAEIATMLFVEPETVRKWKKRGNLPQPPTYASVNGSAAWERPVIVRWAGDSKRLRSDVLIAGYEALVAAEPVVVDDADPIGQIEIAAMFGVDLNTVHQWRKQTLTSRYSLPWPPDYEAVNGSAAWERMTVLGWAGRTGRIRDDALAEAYRAAFGEDPLPERRGGQLMSGGR